MESEREMSKERETLKVIANVLEGALEDGNASYLRSIVASVVADIRNLTSTENAVPQSESEAVRLLREVLKAWQEDVRTQNQAIRCNVDAAICLVRDHLSLVDASPPSPDWRTLAEKAWDGWRRSSDIVTPMLAIRDALASEAAASGKGGE